MTILIVLTENDYEPEFNKLVDSISYDNLNTFFLWSNSNV